MKKPELLAPAGDLTRLRVAFAYGADAVYIGGKTLSMRAKAKNFSREDMAAGVSYAHSIGKKVYVALNICAHNADFSELDEYILFLEKIKADAVLVADAGVFSRVRAVAPSLAIHISTQANVTNFAAAEFWRGAGASRIVAARELSLAEIAEISQKFTPEANLEVEAFVHGAMCMAYSGRCLLGNFINARDANRGECSQPCRFNYSLVEERSGEVMTFSSDCRGTFIFNAKDLCMVAHIAELAGAGISSLKIEGRIRTEYYVAAVTKTYRDAIDTFFENPALYREKIPHYYAELEKVGARGFSTGFYFGKPVADDHDYTGESQQTPQDFLAIVESYDESTGFCMIEQRNKFLRGDTIEILRAGRENFSQTVEHMYDEDGGEILSAPHPMQKIRLKIDKPVKKFDIVRKG